MEKESRWRENGWRGNELIEMEHLAKISAAPEVHVLSWMPNLLSVVRLEALDNQQTIVDADPNRLIRG